MIMKCPWLKITPLALLLTFCLAAPSSRLGAEEPAQKIDVSRLNSRVDDVVIPVPSEIFTALDKMGGSPNWTKEIAPDCKARSQKPPEIGLLLGSVIANGFIAVQAKDATKIKEIGRRVLELSNALGVKDIVLSHCNSITEAADNGKWDAIRAEFDKTQASVRAAMDKLNSKDISELISIGGWLRGTDALTSLVKKDYSADRAELLHQPELLKTFDDQLKRMNTRVKSNPLVMKVHDALKEISPLIDSSSMDLKSVEKINTVTSDLLKTISPATP